MTPLPVVLREVARRDIDEAIDHYLSEGSLDAAVAWVERVERAFAHIARYPEAGSPRYAHELGLLGLRSWPIEGYPYAVFYLARQDHVDVWRVLHGHRDIPAWIGEGA